MAGRSAWGRAAALLVVLLVTASWVGATVLALADGQGADAVPGVGAIGFAAVGALLVWQRPGHRMGPLLLLGAVLLVVLGAGQTYARHALVHDPGSLPRGRFVAWLADAMALPLTGVFAGLLPQLFPTGRVLSPRWRVPLLAVVGFVVTGVVGNAFLAQDLESVPGLANPYAIEGAQPLFRACVQLAGLLGLVALAGSIGSMVTRWRRAAQQERQQLKWLLAGMALLPGPLLLHDADPVLSGTLTSVALLLLAGALWVAVSQHGLYDLDLVVRRGLTYAMVSGLVAGLYVAMVAGADFATGQHVSLVGHALAAVAAASLFQPVRTRVQSGIDRLFYGDRDRPYDVVSRLARRLEEAVLPERVLPGVVETIGEALRVPYAAIELDESGGTLLAAEHGRRLGTPEVFTMVYQGTAVGRLLVCPRPAEPELGPSDRALLHDLARHAGAAAQALQSTLALRRSRAELVSSREEERRRLRRDLHDGLGPTLAGVTLGLHAAQTLLRSHPEEATQRLAALERQVEDAVGEVRRLVYGLRPPALDEFGLVRAVQMQVARMEGAGVEIVVQSPPEGVGRLPAAVEVAAYRIATEALTNVARHAGPCRCVVRFSLDGSLELEVCDDGTGITPGAPPGVGLAAMRERAAEVGGTLLVDSPGRGTRVVARFPAKEPS